MEQVVCKNIQWEKINVWCCGTFFPSENIKQHREEAHSDNVKRVKQSYMCGVCEKSFSRRCAAKIHERIHKSQFPCDFCKKGFQQKSFLEKHKKFCQSSVTADRIERERSNDYAKKTEEAPSRLITNEDSDIGKMSVISDAKTLVKQVVKVNAVKNVKRIVDLNENKYSCDAGTNAKVDGMSKEMNEDVDVVLEDIAVNKEKIKFFEDEIDDDKFCENIKGNLESFKEHKNNYPKEEKGKIAKEICNICGASIDSANMSEHVKHVHTMKDANNFSCEYCGKSFKQKKGLSYHLAVHTGEMNFSCLFCDKKFIRNYQAKQCENKHNGIFKYSCHLCEYKTNSKWALNRHVNCHLNIKPYSCPVCKSKSVTKSDLKYHIRRQHETDGSIISHLEATYPQMYNASESNEGWQNVPLTESLVPGKQSTRKRKWKDESSVEYPIIVRSIDNYSPTKKKRKLFSPKSQKSELFPEVDESGFNETPKYLKVQMKGIRKDCGSLIKHSLKDEKEDGKDKHVKFANESIVTNSSVKDVNEVQNMADILREVFSDTNDENLGVPPLQVLGVPPPRYDYSVTEVNQTI